MLICVYVQVKMLCCKNIAFMSKLQKFELNAMLNILFISNFTEFLNKIKKNDYFCNVTYLVKP